MKNDNRHPAEIASEKRDFVDVQCFTLLKQILEAVEHDESKVVDLIEDYCGDRESAQELFDEAKEAVKERDDLTQEFFQALKDNPIKAKPASKK